MSKTNTLPALLLAGLLLAGAPAGAHAQSPSAASTEDPQAALVRRAGMSRALGSRDASVTVYEVADFECPFCAQFANTTFARIDSAYIRPGRVQWVFVNLPLVMHPNAFQAAEAALCAGAVGDRFWAMHDRLYESQPEWTRADDPHPIFLRYARALGLPADAFSACMQGEKVWPVIMRDAMYATSQRIDGTPTYIIGRQIVAVGAKSFDDWKPILDKALQDAATKAP
jgi:protein-disulfide isomerase